MPKRAMWLFSRPMVVPNRLRLQIRWSPALRKVSRAALMAAMPVEVATAASPPSKMAMRLAKAAVVGLAVRL